MNACDKQFRFQKLASEYIGKPFEATISFFVKKCDEHLESQQVVAVATKPETQSESSPFLSLDDWASKVAHAERDKGSISQAEVRELVGRVNMKFTAKKLDHGEKCDL